MKKLNNRGFSHDIILVLFVLIFAIAGVAYLIASRAATVNCNLYAAPLTATPAGSDSSGTGTQSAPYATLTKLDASLSPGQTGCLVTGTYGGSQTTTYNLNANGTASAPITLTPVPGNAVTLSGFIVMNGAYTTLSGFTIDGSNSLRPPGGSNSCLYSGVARNVSQALQINGSGDIFENNDYSQSVPTLRGNAIGVGFQAPPTGAIIRYNRIHDVGQCVAEDHTVYLHSGDGTQVYDNWMYNDAHGFGVQLYPNPTNSHIYSNVIYNVGSGFIIGTASSTDNTSNNVIDNNVVANAPGLPTAGVQPGVCVSTYWGGSTGTGNSFANNDCFTSVNNIVNPNGTTNTSAVALSNTSSTDPQFNNVAANDFTVTSTSSSPSFAAWGLPTLAQVGPSATGGSGGSGGGGHNPAPPATPTGLTGTPNNGSVTLNWSANPASDNVTVYNIYRIGQNMTHPWATVTSTNFTDSNQIVNGTQYCYQISATNSVGTSAQTAQVCATPQQVSPPPPAAVPATPIGLKASGGGNGSVNLSWKANPASNKVKVYNIYRIGQKFTAPWSTTASTKFTNRSQVTRGTWYCYQISATNSVGTSAKTAKACAKAT